MTQEVKKIYKNPFRPGAGHMPPHLAGREDELKEFKSLLGQETILKNLVLTGLRGIGKTVLLETFKPLAIKAGWLWAGTDLSETTSLTEDNLATRILTDLAIVTSSIVVHEHSVLGFATTPVSVQTTLSFPILKTLFDSTPGLTSDKLKGVLEYVWPLISKDRNGIIFAYDEAQNLADHAAREQYPLSLLLDVFQSLQRKGMRYMLVLTGLPTLFTKLVNARTYAERMFHVLILKPLNTEETNIAIKKPIEDEDVPIYPDDNTLTIIWDVTRGYPYFVQYVCREAFDIWLQAKNQGLAMPRIPTTAIIAKLDNDFFAGRWGRVTSKQSELMVAIALLPNSDSEFTVQDIVEHSFNKAKKKPFSSSHVNQMLAALAEAGLIFKNRHGKYSFAVPLLGDFIKRQVTAALDISDKAGGETKAS